MDDDAYGFFAWLADELEYHDGGAGFVEVIWAGVFDFFIALC